MFRRFLAGTDSPCGVFDRAVIDAAIAREGKPPYLTAITTKLGTLHHAPFPACRCLHAGHRCPLRAALAQTLRIALRQDLDVMDPTLATTYVGRIVFAGLCDKLFDIDEKLNIVPQLATGYEWADDKTLVIHLRPGVKFQDGEAWMPAAVKYYASIAT